MSKDSKQHSGETSQGRIAENDLRVVAEPPDVSPEETETSRPQSLAELRVLQSVVQNMDDALVVVDMDKQVVLSNQAAHKALGSIHGKMLMDEWRNRFEMFKPDGVTPYPLEERPLYRALQGESVDVEDVRLVKRDTGESVWLSIVARPMFDETGAVRGAFGIFHDITRRKQTEATLLLHSRAVASAAEAIFMMELRDEGMSIVSANTGFERLTHYRQEDILGCGWECLVGLETDRVAVRELQEAMAQEREATAELRLYRKDDTPFWCRMSITPVRDSRGRLTHFIGIQSDITELKQTEERLRAAHNELRSANERMKRNLDAAADVQHALLPRHLPDYSWGRVEWHYVPCDELAGDTLNIFSLDKHHVGIFIADVCGHGVASALLSVTVRRMLSPSFSPSSMVVRRSELSNRRRIVPPKQVVESLNRRFAWDAERGQFFTLVYGVLNTKTRKFRYVIAGHPPPILFRQGAEPVMLALGGLPVGLSSGQYHEHSVRLEAGDRLLLYSDGLIDVMNHDREIYGERRLLETFSKSHGLDLSKALDDLERHVEAWRDGAPIHDDISLIAVEMGR